MSSVTRRIRFLSSIFVLPLRDPVLAAKTIGTAAVMSGNRVTLGLGAGWMREEFDLVGQPFAQRGRRMEEMIEVMRALWTGEPVAHEGAFYSFPAMQMRPSPTEPIPIYIGGTSDVALRRAARIADGWASEVQNTEDVKQIQARLSEYRADSPLAAEPLETCVALRDAFTLDHYKRVQEMAITTLITVPWLLHGHTTPSLTQKQDSINRFANEVITQLE
jgi:probable F420-dependent oxidoreductase